MSPWGWEKQGGRTSSRSNSQSVEGDAEQDDACTSQPSSPDEHLRKNKAKRPASAAAGAESKQAAPDAASKFQQQQQHVQQPGQIGAQKLRLSSNIAARLLPATKRGPGSIELGTRESKSGRQLLGDTPASRSSAEKAAGKPKHPPKLSQHGSHASDSAALANRAAHAPAVKQRDVGCGGNPARAPAAAFPGAIGGQQKRFPLGPGPKQAGQTAERSNSRPPPSAANGNAGHKHKQATALGKQQHTVAQVPRSKHKALKDPGKTLVLGSGESNNSSAQDANTAGALILQPTDCFED